MFPDRNSSTVRWDPNHKNQVFLDQSTMLYTQYYSTQILIHRPFITSPGPRPSPSPSLNISTTAARACVQIMHIQSQRGFLPLPNVMWALFNAGLVLLIGVWEGSGAGAKDLADVYKCLSILSIYETRWQTAGRLWCVLTISSVLTRNALTISSAVICCKKLFRLVNKTRQRVASLYRPQSAPGIPTQTLIPGCLTPLTRILVIWMSRWIRCI